MIVRLDTASVIYLDETPSRTENYASLGEARRVAERYVGNRSYSKPFPNEENYLYGDGTGVTTVMVQQDVQFVG
jgi:hypothetical protein